MFAEITFIEVVEFSVFPDFFQPVVDFRAQ